MGVAEELAQEALVSAYRAWPRVRGLDRPDLWVRRVAVNQAISAHRRVVAEVAALGRLRGPDSGREEPADPGRDGQVWTAVRRLPRTQAVAVVLWAVEGLTLAEIGEVLGCSAETARTHLRRARQRLGSALKTEVDDET